MDCSICCEKLNKSTHKEVTCVFCDFNFCRACFQKYISETPLDPHCMNCKKTFTYDFITDNCTSVFVNKTLKTHREDILLDREKALLPETQPYVVLEHTKRDFREQIRLISDQKYELNRQVRQLDNQIRDIHINMERMSIDTMDEPGEDRKKFVRKCPLNDCRGFLSTQWKCGSCEKKICNKCNEEKVDPHVCDPANVATMELLNKDSKPCPKCGTVIYKISGCSQMYCTDCHTPWDWNTSRIVTGTIHNPHYYEFINRGGHGNRNLADIPCGGLPDMYTFRQTLNAVYPYDKPEILPSIHRCITHIENHELRVHVLEDQVQENRGLRIKYLMNELSEAEFKTTLQQNEKKRQKTIAFRNIYQMFINVASDIFRQIVVFCNERRHNLAEKRAVITENITILENLVIYFNENLQKIGKMYKCVYPGITTMYNFANNIQTANRNIQTLTTRT